MQPLWADFNACDNDGAVLMGAGYRMPGPPRFKVGGEASIARAALLRARRSQKSGRAGCSPKFTKGEAR